MHNKLYVTKLMMLAIDTNVFRLQLLILHLPHPPSANEARPTEVLCFATVKLRNDFRIIALAVNSV